jgi:hypothetical protein
MCDRIKRTTFMRALAIVAAGLLAAVSFCSASHAQTKPAPKPGEAARYFNSLTDLLGDLPVDAFLKEVRQGGKVTSATLDVCYSVTVTSERKDRFVLDLKVDGQKLTGNGQTLERKLPVKVDLVRKQSGKTVSFEGKITLGGVVSDVASSDNTDVSEADFQESTAVDDDIEVTPEDFTLVSPGSIAFKLKREAALDFVKSLRGENAKVAYYSLVQDCAVLRGGHQVVKLDVDVERAPALIAKLKSAPGVVAAGYTSGAYSMDRAVRFPAAAWREGGKLARDKLQTTISDTIGKTLSAKLASATRDEQTGEWTLTFKRPSPSIPDLGLTEVIELTVLVGPEKPNGGDRLIVWVGEPTSETVDESGGPKLNLFGSASGSSEEDSTPLDNGETVEALGKELKGQTWDAENSVWK